MTSLLRAIGIYKPPLPFPKAPVPVQDIETAAEQRPRTLKHLIKANHANFGLVLDSGVPNTLSYSLGCAYFLNASCQRLNEIYEAGQLKLSSGGGQWRDSPSEINPDDWTHYLGNVEYQRAYVDFFEDQLVEFAYDWRALVRHYLHNSESPLIYALLGTDGNPLIQLAFALEISSKTLAIESLARACCECPVFLHGHPNHVRGQPQVRFEDILALIDKDEYPFSRQNAPRKSLEDLLRQNGGDLVELTWKWDLDGNLEAEFIKAQMKAVALATSKESYAPAFENMVQSAYALRSLLPLEHDATVQQCLVRQWLLLFLTSYIYADKPSILQISEDASLQLSWEDVEQFAVAKNSNLETSYLGVVRSLKGIGEAWDEQNGSCLYAAARYIRSSVDK